jgi:hypothetical protein
MTNKEIIEKIIDGCREVKKDSGIHEDAKKLATLVIKDCNDALKKEWVGLTDEELSGTIDYVIGFNSCAGWEEVFARAIEDQLRQKNTMQNVSTT